MVQIKVCAVFIILFLCPFAPRIFFMKIIRFSFARDGRGGACRMERVVVSPKFSYSLLLRLQTLLRLCLRSVI